jgi:hypothetical protein
MTKDEALKLALEFIDSVKVHPTQIAARDAIHTAIKQALASPVQDGLCGHESCDCRSYCKKQQPALVQEQIAGFDVVLDESMPPNTMKCVQPAPKNAGAAKMPCGAVVGNVYDAYEAGKKAAQPAVPLTDEQGQKIFEAYCKTLHPLWNTVTSRTYAEQFFYAGLKAAHGITAAPEKG